MVRFATQRIPGITQIQLATFPILVYLAFRVEIGSKESSIPRVSLSCLVSVTLGISLEVSVSSILGIEVVAIVRYRSVMLEKSVRNSPWKIKVGGWVGEGEGGVGVIYWLETACRAVPFAVKGNESRTSKSRNRSDERTHDWLNNHHELGIESVARVRSRRDVLFPFRWKLIQRTEIATVLRASLTNKRVKTRKRSHGRITWPESHPNPWNCIIRLDFPSEESTDQTSSSRRVYFETGIFNHPVPRCTILSIVESL